MNISFNICRVCKFKGSENVVLQDLDEDDLFKFQTCTQITIIPGDGFPHQICERCKTRLNVSFRFIVQAIESHKTFENLLSKINSEIEAITNVIPPNDDEDLRLATIEDATEVNALEITECIQLNEEYIKGDDDTIIIVKDRNEEDLQSEAGTETDEDFTTEVLISEAEHHEELIENCYIEDKTMIKAGVETNLEVYTSENISRKDGKLFQCEKCDKIFSTKTNLNRHFATHHEGRKFQCKICEKLFTQSGSLKQHMYIHTGERPFGCVVCGRTFTQAKTLQLHLRRHTGEKPFRCDHCGVFFRQKDGLKRHVSVKHEMASNENV